MNLKFGQIVDGNLRIASFPFDSEGELNAFCEEHNFQIGANKYLVYCDPSSGKWYLTISKLFIY